MLQVVKPLLNRLIGRPGRERLNHDAVVIINNTTPKHDEIAGRMRVGAGVAARYLPTVRKCNRPPAFASEDFPFRLRQNAWRWRAICGCRIRNGNRAADYSSVSDCFPHTSPLRPKPAATTLHPKVITVRIQSAPLSERRIPAHDHRNATVWTEGAGPVDRAGRWNARLPGALPHASFSNKLQ